MRLILIRHGLTNDNVRRVMQGEQGAPLNEEGIEQARRVSERFAHDQIDLIVSSPQARAMQTAMIIARNHRHLHPIPMALLQERHAGDTVGLDYKEFSRLSGEHTEGHHHYRPPAGESLLDVGVRARLWHEFMMRQYFGLTIIAVTHGRFLMPYLAWLKYGTIDHRSDKFKSANTGVSVVNAMGPRPRLEDFNDTSHLVS